MGWHFTKRPMAVVQFWWSDPNEITFYPIEVYLFMEFFLEVISGRWYYHYMLSYLFNCLVIILNWNLQCPPDCFTGMSWCGWSHGEKVLNGSIVQEVPATMRPGKGLLRYPMIAEVSAIRIRDHALLLTAVSMHILVLVLEIMLIKK